MPGMWGNRGLRRRICANGFEKMRSELVVWSDGRNDLVATYTGLGVVKDMMHMA